MKKIKMEWRMIFGAVMVLVYLGMGSMLIFSRLFDVNRTLGLIVGLLMMLYGVFRGVRLYKNME